MSIEIINDKAVCSNCGNEIGEIFSRNGVQLLRVGGMIGKVDGVCCKCNADIRWSPSLRDLQRFLRLTGRDVTIEELEKKRVETTE